VVNRGFISDVMVSVLSSSVVDRGFISDVMVSVLASSVVDRGFISDVNPRSITLEESTLTITSLMRFQLVIRNKTSVRYFIEAFCSEYLC
jgi:hypothetical protein